MAEKHGVILIIFKIVLHESRALFLTLLHSERPKLYGVLTVLSAIGLTIFLLADVLLYFMNPELCF